MSEPISITPDRLWAPWRVEYIKQSNPPSGCIFCDFPKASDDRENLIVHRGDKAFVIMNRYPYNNGHVMIVPYQHTALLSDLCDSEMLELMHLLRQTQAALDLTMQPQGYNIGMNLGRVAGAGIDAHLHIHVVPRWNGDTNFMPVTGGTKVISEALDQSWEQLKNAFAR